MALDKAIFQAALGQICAFRTQGDTSVRVMTKWSGGNCTVQEKDTWNNRKMVKKSGLNVEDKQKWSHDVLMSLWMCGAQLPNTTRINLVLLQLLFYLFTARATLRKVSRSSQSKPLMLGEYWENIQAVYTTMGRFQTAPSTIKRFVRIQGNLCTGQTNLKTNSGCDLPSGSATIYGMTQACKT